MCEIQLYAPKTMRIDVYHEEKNIDNQLNAQLKYTLHYTSLLSNYKTRSLLSARL